MKLVEQKMKGEEEEGGAPALPVTMLQNIWTNSARKVIYFNSVRVGKDTFSCGECVMMDTESGRFPAEILYIFKDKHGGKWVENRWLFTKDEVEEQLPRNMRPSIDDDEVFETNSVQANPAGAILHKIAVLDKEDYRRKVGNSTVRENDRFCRWSLDTRLNRLMEAGDQAPGSRLRRGRRFSEQSGPPDDSESDDGSDSSTSPSCDDGDSIDEQLEHPERGAEDESHARSGDQERPSKRRRSSRGGSRGGKGPKDKFSVAMDSLHVTAVPKSLPCRTKEQRVLLNFLRSNIKSGGLGNAMFVAGMPGTGKTATAHEVVSILREQQENNELPCFKLVELNGMRLINPHQAYTQLWMSLSGKALSPKRALSKLDHYFSQGDPSRDFVVLLVDELDYMTTSKQTVLYNLFEWPSRPHARLVVVGIANTMDLPERCMPRVSSRLTSRITFPAYKRAELVTILEARLAEANSSMGKVFDGSAVTMAAAKVGSASGDMRTCLKYCCRAVEVCRARVEVAKSEGRGDEEKCQVSVDDVRCAVQEITQQAHLLAVRDSSPQERLLLVAICNEIHHGGKGTVAMDDVRERMEGICRAHPNGPRMPNAATILEMLSRLGDEQVLLMDLSRRTPLPDVELNMTVRDVVQMLRDDVEFSRKVLPSALTAEYPPLSELPK